MQIHPRRAHLFDTDRLYLRSLPKEYAYQHGYPKHSQLQGGICRLLSLPPESLTHITSFLDFASLFALGKTTRALHDHVDDDNTWRSAFLRQFLGLDSYHGSLADSSLSALLHRTEDTWKEEYVSRCNLLRRWERSRGGATTHCPHYSPIATMHLLEERSHGPALLSASLNHGIVARSVPLTGKVLKGYLSAQDGAGIGLGNPNVEFVPNTSACAIDSQGWNASIAWGFTNGEIALVTANRVLEVGRNSMAVVRCRVNDQHRGRVTNMCWVGSTFVSAAVDGEVRIWNKSMDCLWLLKDPECTVPDACTYVTADFESGTVISTKQSGRTVVWTGVKVDNAFSGRTGALEPMNASPHLVIPCLSSSKESNAISAQTKPAKLFLQKFVHESKICCGIHYSGDLHFYRVDVNLTTGTYDPVKFADGPIGPIRALYAYDDTSHPAGQSQLRTVVMAGDSLGRVSVFDWSGTPDDKLGAIPSFRCIDACPDVDGGITAISCTECLLVIGTARGSTLVFDILASRYLRGFSTPAPRFGPHHDVGEDQDLHSVKQIIVEKDLLIVSVGERVLAWNAGPVNAHKGKVVKRATPKSRTAKWHKRLELSQDIDESQAAAADVQAYAQRSYTRQRAQLAALGDLGLDEGEAVEYALMLSRDEEESRMEQDAASRSLVPEGVFEADFEDIPSVPESITASPASSSQVSPRSSPLFGPTASNIKVQVTPPFRPEPMEAGFSTSPLGLAGRSGSQSRPRPSLGNEDHFPSLSSSVSSTGESPSSRVSPSVSAAGSWSRRLNTSVPLSDTTSPPALGSSSLVRRSVSGPATPAGQSLLSASLRMHEQGAASPSASAGTRAINAGREEEMDADLRLAIELSLAEELSRQ